jgi:hypothetical protein
MSLSPTARLALPSLDAATAFLDASADPFVSLARVRLDTPEAGPRIARLRAAVEAAPLVERAFASQRSDGSWGDHDDPGRRVLSTLWMTKALAELGVDDRHAGWHRAAEYLAGRTHTTTTGVLGLDGRDAGVLSCYAGIAGEMYLLAGRPDLARPQIEWILRHQDVRVRGGVRRSPAAEPWDERLRTRYGGCLADTTCLVGLVKTGRALLAWHEQAADPDAAELASVIRETYLERRLMYRTNGEIVPIGISGGAPDRWLQPAFPLDWHTDLVEVLDFVARSGPPDARMQPAIDRIIEAQLPDGTWPLRQTYRPRQLPAPERRSRTSGSPMITLRVVAAVTACGLPSD